MKAWGSKWRISLEQLGKEYIKAVYFHPVCLTYVQNTSYKMLGLDEAQVGMRLPGEISITSDMQVRPP